MAFRILRSREICMIPAVWNMRSETREFVRKTHGIAFSRIYCYLARSKFVSFYEENEWESVCSYIFNKILDNKQYVSSIYKRQKKAGIYLVEFYRNIMAMDLEDKLIGELLGLYRDIRDAWMQFDGLNVLPWFAGGDLLNRHLQSLLRREGLDEKEVDVMLTAPKISFSMEEERRFLDILLQAKDLGLGSAFRMPVNKARELLPSDIVEKIRKLSSDYHWIAFGYDGMELYDESYYIKSIRQNLEKTPAEIRKRIGDINSYERSIMSKQRKISEDYSLDEDTLRLLSDSHALCRMTDERKIYHFQIHIGFHRVLERLCSRLHLSMTDIKYLFLEEMENPKKDFQKLKEIASKRQSGPYILIKRYGKGFASIKGREFERITKEIFGKRGKGFVRGTAASRSARKVKGTARIVLNPRDIRKVRDGDVLVSNMTTPEYVPAMRKAAAIITDEGGITCHAAIISREMKKPCIIGTKTATKVLKDGDLVEVDADKGVVRKVK